MENTTYQRNYFKTYTGFPAFPHQLPRSALKGSLDRGFSGSGTAGSSGGKLSVGSLGGRTPTLSLVAKVLNRPTTTAMAVAMLAASVSVMGRT
jgi:hypothetical protein